MPDTDTELKRDPVTLKNPPRPPDVVAKPQLTPSTINDPRPPDADDDADVELHRDPVTLKNPPRPPD